MTKRKLKGKTHFYLLKRKMYFDFHFISMFIIQCMYFTTQNTVPFENNVELQHLFFLFSSLNKRRKKKRRGKKFFFLLLLVSTTYAALFFLFSYTLDLSHCFPRYIVFYVRTLKVNSI